MKLKFKLFNTAPIIFILACCSFAMPLAFFYQTVLFKKGHYLTLIWMQLLFLFTIFFLWYKVYNEIIIAKIDNGILHYKKLFFINYSINLSDIKGFKIGSEETDFLVLYNKNDKKLFVIRMDFYSNYYDFVDALNVKQIGIYYTAFQRIVMKIFRKKID